MSSERPAHIRPLPTRTHRAERAPAAVTRLIGRDRELDVLRRRLLREDVRLLTLTGPAGVGKTRLALAAAAALEEGFADGMRFVDLAPIRDPDLVVTAIARALGVREAGGRPLRADLEAYLRERELLLVLDNVEQVVRAGPEVAELLVRCPSMKILATSRMPLRVYGEHELAVPPLELPESRIRLDPAPLGRTPAVRLFVERAQAIKPDFALTKENAGAVAELCIRLDGLPLALELAAARITLLSPPAILARLDRRLDLLAAGPRDRPPRQQSLRAALAWSHDLLTADEQALFRRLAVFAGGCALEAAEVVAGTMDDGRRTIHAQDVGPPSYVVRGPSSVFEGLASLVAQSLLRSEEQADGEPRFSMLETIREYALERLEVSGEAAVARQRHAAYYLALAEEADPKLRSAEQLPWLERLEGEHDNLRAALVWGLSPAGESATAMRLAAALAWFWYLRGHFSEGRGWLDRALAAPEKAPASTRARGLNGAGNLAYAHGDYAGAAAAYEEGLALFRGLGDTQGVANVLNNLGNLARARGDYPRAVALLEENLALRRQLGDRGGLALALNNLGLVAHHGGDHARAARFFEESLALNRELGDRHHVALALNNLGNLAQQRGDYTLATTLHQENLALCRELGDTRGVANTLNNLALVAQDRGDYTEAAAMLEESQALSRELGDQDGIANALNNLGLVARDRGDAARAAALLEESLTLFRQGGNTRGAAWSLNGLGSVARDRGDTERAGVLLEEGLALCRELGDRRGIAWTLHNLGAVAHDRGDDGRAAALHREALGLGYDTADRSIVAACTEALAGVAVARGRAEQAARLLGAAEALREAIGSPLPPARRADYERDLAAVRAVLDEAAAAAAWAEGRALTPEQALEHEDSAHGGSGKGGGPVGPLTRREAEVTRLIARGLTNRQIAVELVITEGTVGTHVEHILRKLDFQSRTQVAAWALRSGLVPPDSN